MSVLNKEELNLLDGYFRASNYLTVGQLYLLDNPLLKEKLTKDHIKKKIVGHWGTCPGQNFVYTHCNRVINKYNLDMIYVSGPGHGGNSIVSQVYLEGTYSDYYKTITEDEEGMKKLFKQFSFPGGISSHVAPETPGSINEGGELGYSLSHAFGAVLDNKNLIATVVVGDGEAETGPLATSWHSNKFLNPVKDGAVLPILHLNGYKISNPTVLSRIPESELISLFEGYGYNPIIVDGNKDEELHENMAIAMDKCIKKIKAIQNHARDTNISTRPIWPMIILKTKKGWTGPGVVNNKQIEGTFRSHQVPITIDTDEDINKLEKWLKSYRPEELFDDKGSLKKEYQALIPKHSKRMGASPFTNGGQLLKELKTPDLKELGIDVKTGKTIAEDTRILGKYIREVIKLNPKNYLLMAPDETMSNRLSDVFTTTDRNFNAKRLKNDEFLSDNGRILDSMLSEHCCEGWLEGYLLTGRHGAFSSYEAFLRIIDSMTAQHLKWLKMTNEIPWRLPISSLNYIVTSNVWQQDHNGYTHQDPGFLSHLAEKKQEFVNMYLPADANTLLAVFDKATKSKHCVNAIVASKHPRPQWLTINQAINHVKRGISIWNFASNDENYKPDIILACCGDTPTYEMMAAQDILSKNTNLKIRFINVVELAKLANQEDNEKGLSNEEFDKLFTKETPVIFSYHGYPNLIKSLLYNRTNKNIKILGYQEEGAITTAFDMRVKNKIDRFNIVKLALSLTKTSNPTLNKQMNTLLDKHFKYIREEGIDIPEIEDYVWKK